MSEIIPPISDAYTESQEPIPDEPIEAYQKLFEEVSYTEDSAPEEPEQQSISTS